MYHYDSNQWLSTGHAGAASGANPYTFSVNHMSELGLFSFQNAAALPLELLLFSAKAVSPNVLLQWTTATERALSHFEVERLWEGTTQWQKLGVMTAQNSLSTTSYQFLDKNVMTKKTRKLQAYYRLKMVNEDGTFEYSQVEVVEWKDEIMANKFTIYPNPVQHQVQIDWSGWENTSPNLLRVIDVFGKIVLQKNISEHQPHLQLNLREEQLATGTYWLQILEDDEVLGEEKLVKI